MADGGGGGGSDAAPAAAGETPTVRQQRDLETRIASIFRDLADLDASGRVHRVHRGEEALTLQRERHARFAAAGAGRLPAAFASLDASRPWICFWVLHSLQLLSAPLPEGLAPEDFIAFLAACAAPGGGYGGGPGQMAHLAPTYAAVAALLTLGGEAAYESIDRPAIAGFLRRMAVPPERGGGFTMHDGGETDARSCYTALAVAHMLHLDVEGLAAASGVADYLKRCQTYEGGLGGCPGNEAHGGYTYCGAAALAILGRLPDLDLPRLTRWVAQRQGCVEGGFNGRTNKLVDGCYSFWQGAVLPLVLREAGAALREQALRRGAPVAGDLGIEVPALPRLEGVCTPYEEACKESERLNDWAEALVERALEAEGEVLSQHQQQKKKQQQQQQQQSQEASGSGTAAAGTAGAAGGPETDGGGESAAAASGSGDLEREARRLLKLAEEAQRASEEADLSMEIAQYSAAQLFVCFDGEGSRGSWATASSDGHPQPQEQGDHHHHQQQQEEGAQGDGEAAGPLFEADALQVWILKGCQQPLKGGLRDKPGKPPDYYHTCYCLSGLSVAQHAAKRAQRGGAVLGAAANELARTDLLVNVVESKRAEAAAYFGRLPRL